MPEQSLFILTPGFPKDESDSTCLPSQQLFVLTAKKIFPELDILVISLQYPAEEIHYTWNGVPVYALHGRRYKGLLRFIFWYKTYRRLRGLASGKNVVGVLSFWCNESALLGNYLARKKQLVHKIWICGQDARQGNPFVRWIKPRPHELVAMSYFLQHEFLKNHNVNPQYVIENAVLHTFQNLKKDVDVIGAGSLIPLKQFSLFVEVIAEVRKAIPSLRVMLFGNGPEEALIKKLIVELNLTETIALHNEVDHTILMHWMNRSKVLLHPSSYEGYSTVCLEALANGCHVVSFTSAERTRVPHWHIVDSKKQMTANVLEILTEENDFSPIVLHAMEKTVKSMLGTFGVQPK